MINKKQPHIVIGDTLTVTQDKCNSNGELMYKRGDRVKVSEVLRTGLRWSCQLKDFVPGFIYAVKVEGAKGIWPLSEFNETRARLTYVLPAHQRQKPSEPKPVSRKFYKKGKKPNR